MNGYPDRQLREDLRKEGKGAVPDPDKLRPERR